MRKLAVVALAAAAIFVAVLALRGEEPYRVRAIFDTASFLIPGEDVKVAGVVVGRVAATEVTRDFKAAVVLEIDDPGYRDFRADARCTIRPQSLIGEKFVECTPGGDAPPLRVVDGERVLPVESTGTAVDLDLVQNIMRRPYRERLAIILNELGVGLAGRADELDAVIRRASPALRELDEVLAILGRQNRVLARLARNGDRALAPLAAERRRVGSFIESANAVAEATAARRADLDADLARLPAALRELRPTMDRLGAAAGELTPVLADLGAAAPDVTTVVRELGPFAAAARPAFRTLGDAARTGRPALVESEAVVRALGETAAAARRVGPLTSALLRSFARTGGIEQALRFLYHQVAATNGFDDYGHYLRANLLVNTCSTYATAPQSGCSAKFRAPESEDVEALAARALPPARAPDEPLLEYLFGGGGSP